MRRTTLALITAVIGITLVLSAVASAAATHETAGGKRWTIADLGTFGPRWTSGSAAAINERGQVVGTNGTAGGKQHAFLWQNGKMTDLGTLGGRDSGASAINAHGQVVGTSLTSAPQHVHAFLWENGKMKDLGTLGGKSSRPRALNDRGQVVGESFTAGGAVHAFLWRNGKMIDLGTLGGSDSFASGVDDRGQVVGSSSTANGTQHAFLWQNGKMIDLGTLGARFTSSSCDGYQRPGPDRRHELPREGHADRPAGPRLPLAEREDDRPRHAGGRLCDERGGGAQRKRRDRGLQPLGDRTGAPGSLARRQGPSALWRHVVRSSRCDQRSRPGDRRTRSSRWIGRARVRLGQRQAHGPRHAGRSRERRVSYQRAEPDRRCQPSAARRSTRRSLDVGPEVEVRLDQQHEARPNGRASW